MFRITRGHHVQHIHFPRPFIRDLAGAEEEASDPRQSPPSAAERERAENASAGTPEAAQ